MSNEKKDLLETIKRLGYSVADIHKATKIPVNRMYKWYQGDGLPKVSDFKLLKIFLESVRQPTNDFYGNVPEKLNMVAEDIVPHLHPFWSKEIDMLSNKIEALQLVIKAKDDLIESLRSQIPPKK